MCNFNFTMDNTHGVNVLGLSYTPAETIEVVSRAGTHRGMMRPDKVFLAAVYGGILLSFGCAASLILNAEPWYTQNAPGIPRLLGALVFPVGLVLIVLTGAELFTASNMVGTRPGA
jgi:formate/nitrite transporter FocA (FNT family)